MFLIFIYFIFFKIIVAAPAAPLPTPLHIRHIVEMLNYCMTMFVIYSPLRKSFYSLSLIFTTRIGCLASEDVI